MQPAAPSVALKWMLQGLALAVTYYVAARLALLMAIPPGYAAAVWPAAGIALVAIMVWGKRVWPGIVLGSFLVNIGIPAGLAAGALSQQSWIALGIATGAALQAVIGGALVRRWVNPTNVFPREMELAKLLFLAGPLACVVSASTGVVILYLAGVVSASDLAFHWWTWWVGDTIGVLLVVPVYLTWTASPQQMSLWRKIQLSIPLTALGALVVLVFVYTSAMEQQRLQAEFSRRTEQLTRALAQDVRGYTDVLEAIGDLYASEPEVGRGQFATFVRRSLAERPGIQALSWNPRIAAGERAGFEAAARAEGYSGFQITELAADGDLQPAAPRAWYVPIRHIEPYADNQVALGFDVASDPDRLAALRAARDSGRSTATGSITLVQAAGHPYGFLLALPVYGHGELTATLAQRRQNLRGYAVAAFRMEELMAAFLRGQDTTGMRIRLLDIGASKAASVLYQLGPPTPPAEPTGLGLEETRTDAASITPADSFTRRRTLVVGGRRLALHFALTPEHLHTQRSWLAWSVLAIGLLFTGLLGAFLLIVAGRAGLIENIVVQRTAQLRLANEALEQSRRGLAENELRLEEAQKIAQVGSWEWDLAADEISWSEELRRIYGASVNAIRPSYETFLEYTHPDDRPRVDAAVRRAMASHQPFGFEHRILRADGTVRTIQAHGRVVASGSGEPARVLGTAQDITELKDAEQHLLQLAHFDALTGLPNRALFCKTLADALAQARKQGWVISVLFLDLDRFKNINDTLGHACGDALLRQLAGRLADTLRVRDTVARFGGDEFAIMLINADDQHNAATIVADKLREALRAPFHLDGHEVTVTASIGATVFPADSDEPDVLIKYADTAMYAAKEAGRDTYRFYTAAMNADVVRRLALETALRRALDRDEFVLHYQPKLDIGSGQWTGVEALLRWNRPGHGLVPPGEFIPLLEETGLIEPVGAWVINAACRQIAAWVAAGMAPIPIAVNVSVKQLLRGLDFEPFGTVKGDNGGTDSSALERTVEAALREHGVAPHLLEIELTESTLMLNAAKTVELLQRLRTMGLHIAIDDFGTGYSSLAYLKRFSASIIKIDQSFIRDIAIDSDDAAIAAAIIIMAHSLRLRVIAEGVETAEQLAFLREQGCDEAQGFLLARPMPAEACAQVLRAGAP